MAKKSAGILVFRFVKLKLEVLLVHPGGPFWAKKDLGVWSIPKGEFTDEDPLTAAKREFLEETGYTISGNFIPLTPVKQKSGKVIYAWAVKGDLDIATVKSNLFEMEWPPKSGRKQFFPEVDKAGWFTIKEAKVKAVTGQLPFIEELVRNKSIYPQH
jgi:predicted NUDIX family NTP pyrophosphohydrolase